MGCLLDFRHAHTIKKLFMIKNSHIRKILVVLIIIVPLFADLACKKQPKCGCDGDMVFSYTEQSVYVYFDPVNTSASFTDPYDPYSSFSFCNAQEMMSTLSKYKSGNLLLLTGKVYYECNYLLNSGSNPYSASYKVYQVNVTEVKEDLYGK
jgi:hypothetical protein